MPRHLYNTVVDRERRCLYESTNGTSESCESENLELRVRIDRETSEILEELAKHYNEPKSVVVRNAIQQLYAKTKNNVTAHPTKTNSHVIPKVTASEDGMKSFLSYHPGRKKSRFCEHRRVFS